MRQKDQKSNKNVLSRFVGILKPGMLRYIDRKVQLYIAIIAPLRDSYKGNANNEEGVIEGKVPRCGA